MRASFSFFKDTNVHLIPRTFSTFSIPRCETLRILKKTNQDRLRLGVFTVRVRSPSARNRVPTRGANGQRNTWKLERISEVMASVETRLRPPSSRSPSSLSVRLLSTSSAASLQIRGSRVRAHLCSPRLLDGAQRCVQCARERERLRTTQERRRVVAGRRCATRPSSLFSLTSPDATRRPPESFSTLFPHVRAPIARTRSIAAFPRARTPLPRFPFRFQTDRSVLSSTYDQRNTHFESPKCALT